MTLWEDGYVYVNKNAIPNTRSKTKIQQTEINITAYLLKTLQ
jgi:hypothetical protein